MNLENRADGAPGAGQAHAAAGGIFSGDISAGTFKNLLLYLFLLGLIVRAGYLVEHAGSPSFGVVTLDQKYYDTAARMLVNGEDLHDLHGFRPLLYPMFLAVLDRLGGAHGFDLTVMVQHLIGVTTGLLVATLGARLFQNRLCGLAGGVLYLLAPLPLCFEGELLIESSYIFLICVGLLLLFHAAGVGGWKGLALWQISGSLTVLTAQERPNILVFMAVYPLLAGWHWWRSRRAAALLPLVALIGAAAMSVAWGFVNKIQLDQFQMLPGSGGVNLYFGNKRTADGMMPEQERRVTYGDRYQDSGEVWAQQEYASVMRARGLKPEGDPQAVSRFWTWRAIHEIQAAPGPWLRLMAKKSWLMLWNTEVPNNKSFAFLQTEFAWLRWLPVRWVILLMLAPAGIWAAARWGNRDPLFILLVYVLFYSAGDIAFFICDRYRYPIWPALAVIGGGGLMAIVETFRRHRWREVSWIAVSMALMAVISLPNWFEAKLPSFARDYLFRSIAWYEKGHFPEALNDVDRGLILDPDEVTALHHRGNVLLAMNLYDDARLDYERTLKIDAEDGGIWNNYGIALDGMGRIDQAIKAYRRATQCNPPSESAFFGVVFDEIRLDRSYDAAAVLDIIDKRGQGPNAVVLAIRSVLAQRRGDAARAAELERQARAIDADAATWAIAHSKRVSAVP